MNRMVSDFPAVLNAAKGMPRNTRCFYEHLSWIFLEMRLIGLSTVIDVAKGSSPHLFWSPTSHPAG